MIKILGRDNRNWIRVDGVEVDWTNYSIKYKNDRVQPAFMAPNIIEDTWNGLEFPIQHEQYDVYSCEFTVKESEKKYLSQLLSFSDVQIIDFEIDSTDTIINASYDVDTTKSDNLTIEEIGDNIGKTSGARYKIIFKTNRLIINKCLPVNYTNNLIINSNSYYTDYELLDYTEPIENIHIDFPNGDKKIARTINKYGKEALFYMLTSDYDDFIYDLKVADTITLSTSNIEEYSFESSLIAENIWRVVFRGITNTVQTNYDLAPNSTYTLSMDSGGVTYVSDYPFYQIVKDVKKVDVEWDDGNVTTLQTIKKIGYEFVWFGTSLADFLIDVNTYDDVTLNSQVLTEIEVSEEEIADHLYQATLRGVYSIDIDNLYTFPTSGGTLVITDETPTAYTYYTDFTSEIIPVTPEKNTSISQTGINITTKSITKTALRLRFYIGQTNAFNIKKYCELFKPGWTCTWNAGTVYEILNSNNIEPKLLEGSPLSSPIYEVIVDILTAVTTN